MSDATLATRSLRNAPGRFATGVAIVTALDPDGQPIGLTVNSFAAVSLDPALALWCLDNTNLLANNVGAVLVKPAPRANLPASLCDISFEKV
ncbi:MAG: flavin reductase family protein, partial [Desulfobulbus sp.]|nr:flavin reductase family protein [Desulfobulbus sp.]